MQEIYQDTQTKQNPYKSIFSNYEPNVKTEFPAIKVDARDFVQGYQAPTVLSSKNDRKMQEASDTILQMLAESPTSKGLDSVYDFAFASIMSTALDTDFNKVSKNLDMYINMFAGDNVTSKSWLEAFNDNWKTDHVSAMISIYQNAIDMSNDEEYINTMNKKIEKMEKDLIRLSDYSSRSWLGRTSIKSAPIMRQVLKSMAISMATGAVGGAIGAVAQAAEGTGKAAQIVGLSLKGLKEGTRAAQIGRKVGAVVNMADTFIRESGSISRELYTMVDEDGNRVSDGTRMIAKLLYGAGATAVEYFTIEPFANKWIKGTDFNFVDNFVNKVAKDSFVRQFVTRDVLGAISESMEEGVQQFMEYWSKDLAVRWSDSTGETRIGTKPADEAFKESMSEAWEAVKETFGPTLLVGMPGATVESYNVAAVKLARRLKKVDKNKSYDSAKPHAQYSYAEESDLRRAASQYQDFTGQDIVIDIDHIVQTGQKPSKDFGVNEEGSNEKLGVIDVMPSNEQNGMYVGVTEEDNEKIMWLARNEAEGVAVRIHEDAGIATIANEDFGTLVDNMGGYVTDTEVHFDTKEDLDLFLDTTDDFIKVDDNSRISFLNDDGETVTLDAVVDNNVIQGNRTATAPSISESGMKISEAIQSASNGNISTREADALGQFISAIKGINADEVASSIVVKDTDVGRSLEMEGAKGAVDLSSLQIILSDNSDAVTVLHEGFHIMLQLDKDSRVNLLRATRSVMQDKGQRQQLKRVVQENIDMFQGKTVDEIMGLLSTITSDDKLTTDQIETLVDLHSAYARNNRGKNIPSAIKRIFNEIANAFRKIYKQITGKSLLPSQMEKAYSKFYNNKNDIDTNQTGGEYGSQTAIREGLSYQRRDDFFSNVQREDSIGKSKNELRTATGVSKDIRVSEGENLRRSDESTRRLLLLDKTVKLLDPKAKAVEFNQLDNTNIAIVSKFKNALDNARETQKYGLYVDSYSLETYTDEEGEHIGYSDPRIKLFMSEDESIGFAIKKDGDIVSVFKDPSKGSHPNCVYSILLAALENGGTKLDCYGEKLLKIYMRMGFVPVGKVAYNEKYESEAWKARKDVLGSPNVYALYWSDSSIDETINNLEHRIKTISDIVADEIASTLDEYTDIEENGKKVDGYDQLMDTRDKLLEESVSKDNIMYQKDPNLQKEADWKTSDTTEQDKAYNRILNHEEMNRFARRSIKNYSVDMVEDLINAYIYVPNSLLENFQIESNIVDKEINDRLLMKKIISDSDKELLELSPNLRSFIEKLKAEKETDWNGQLERIYTKYYIYQNVLKPSEMQKLFISEYNNIDKLMALKSVLTRRRIYQYNESTGQYHSRFYIPATGTVYKEIVRLNRNSSESVVNAILDSIRSNPDPWIKAYLKATRDYQRVAALETGSDEWLRLTSKIQYLTLADSEFKFLDTIRQAGSDVDTDVDTVLKNTPVEEDATSYAQDYLVSADTIEAEKKVVNDRLRAEYDKKQLRKDWVHAKKEHKKKQIQHERDAEKKRQYDNKLKAEKQKVRDWERFVADVKLFNLREKKDQQIADIRFNEAFKRLEQKERLEQKHKEEMEERRQKEKERVESIREKDKAREDARVAHLKASQKKREATKEQETKLRNAIKRNINVNLATHDASIIESAAYLYDASNDHNKKTDGKFDFDLNR